jgi:hypothetical protein
MTDIAKCNGNGCHKKYSCYRHEAASSQAQCWIDPVDCIDDAFSMYWPFEKIEEKQNGGI